MQTSATQGAQPALQVRGLVKDYPVASGWHRAVDGIEFEVTEGQKGPQAENVRPV